MKKIELTCPYCNKLCDFQDDYNIYCSCNNDICYFKIANTENAIDRLFKIYDDTSYTEALYYYINEFYIYVDLIQNKTRILKSRTSLFIELNQIKLLTDKDLESVIFI